MALRFRTAQRCEAGALRVGRAVGAAVTNRRVLGATEAKTISWFAWIPVGVAVLAIFFPRVIAWPIAASEAIISVKDQRLPLLADLRHEELTRVVA